MALGYTPRQREILGFLVKHGILGTGTMFKLMRPRVTMAQLIETLSWMERRGLICRLVLHPGGAPMGLWMLPEEESARGRALKATGIQETFFRQKRVRYSHVPHEIICTYVHESLERQMPKLCFAREATDGFEGLPSHLLSKQAKENGYKPDLCIGVPCEGAEASHPNSKFRWLATEVDRSYRNHKTLAQRLNIYTKYTAFSGLLYLMPSRGTQAVLQQIYDERGGKNTLRLHGSSKAFLAIGTIADDLFDVNAMSVWCGDQEISLAAWLSLFALTNAQERDRALSAFA